MSGNEIKDQIVAGTGNTDQYVYIFYYFTVILNTLYIVYSYYNVMKWIRLLLILFSEGKPTFGELNNMHMIMQMVSDSSENRTQAA